MAINTKNIKLTHSTLDNIKTKESPAEKTAFVIRLYDIGSNNDDEIFKIIAHSYDPLRKEIIELFISHLKQ